MHRLTINWRRLLPGVIALGLVAALLAGCGGSYGGQTAKDQRKSSIQKRTEAFARAEAAVPLPRTTNFGVRRALAEMTIREDLANHPWYVYLLGDNGNTIGYYVAKYPPVNACNFLSSTEDVQQDDNGYYIGSLQAPSLDGVYYGAASCDWWVIFDVGSNAMIKIRGLKFYLADAPLALDAKPIRVASG